MTSVNKKKQDKRSGGISPVVVAVTGAVVGVGVAVAGAVALRDKKNRDKVKKVLVNAKNQAVGYVEDMRKQAEGKKEEIEEKIDEGKEKIKKVAAVTKDSINHEVNDAKKEVK